MPDAAQPARTLVRKLAEVMKEVGRVPKRGHNAHFNYKFATEVDVVAAVQTKLAERNVMLFPSVVGIRRDGKLTTLDMVMTFCDGDSGEEKALPWAGQGEDSSDKGEWKAITGAVKFFILKTFLVPTGDDPEATDADGRSTAKPARPERRPAAQAREDQRQAPVASADDARPISAEAVTRLTGMMREHGTDERALGRWVRDTYGYTKWKDIKRKDYEAITDHVARAARGAVQAPTAAAVEDFTPANFK